MPKTVWYNFCQNVLFSSRRFIVSSLIIRSLIHFEFIFIFRKYVLDNVLISLFTCSCPVFPAALSEESVFSPLYIHVSFVVN